MSNTKLPLAVIIGMPAAGKTRVETRSCASYESAFL